MIKAYFMKRSYVHQPYIMIGYAEEEERLPELMQDALEANAYEYVATVKEDDLDLAWNMTNSIDCPWYEYEGVLNFKGMAEAEGRCRSAMVGDIYVLNGKAYVIAPVGFNQIGDDDFAMKVAQELEKQNGN